MGLEEIILEETRKQGEKRGLKKGLEKGLEKAKILVVHNSWKERLTPEVTARITEFPIEDVIRLYAKFSSSEDRT